MGLAAVLQWAIPVSIDELKLFEMRHTHCFWSNHVITNTKLDYICYRIIMNQVFVELVKFKAYDRKESI